jgi:hypothetical protein
MQQNITHHHVNVINACNKWSITLPSIQAFQIIQFAADFNNILQFKLAAELNKIVKIQICSRIQ